MRLANFLYEFDTLMLPHAIRLHKCAEVHRWMCFDVTVAFEQTMFETGFAWSCDKKCFCVVVQNICVLYFDARIWYLVIKSHVDSYKVDWYKYLLRNFVLLLLTVQIYAPHRKLTTPPNQPQQIETHHSHQTLKHRSQNLTRFHKFISTRSTFKIQPWQIQTTVPEKSCQSPKTQQPHAPLLAGLRNLRRWWTAPNGLRYFVLWQNTEIWQNNYVSV